jgi:hypothetical protein
MGRRVPAIQAGFVLGIWFMHLGNVNNYRLIHRLIHNSFVKLILKLFTFYSQWVFAGWILGSDVVKSLLY